MDEILFVANWKSHKSKVEALGFFEQLMDQLGNVDMSGKKLIVAPPFTVMSELKRLIIEKNLPVVLAGQNVSPFPQGAYTGEINAHQLKEFCEYVIIGHSERRKYFHESESDIENKVREAKEAGLVIIQCIQDENGVVHNGVDVVAYEPPSAIGSGNPDDPEHVGEVVEQVRKKAPQCAILYGGSVNPENIHAFKSIPSIGGFLVGGASLETQSFLTLLS